MVIIVVSVLMVLMAIAAGWFIFRIVKQQRESKESNKKYIPTTQDQLPFEYIRNGIIKLKKGAYCKIIQVPSINIELMEGDEQEFIRQLYAGILNSMKFKFQYLLQSRVVDVSDYLLMVNQRMDVIDEEENPLAKKQLEYYRQYVGELVKTNAILTKSSYLVVPYEEHVAKRLSGDEEETLQYRRQNLEEVAGVVSDGRDTFTEEELRFERVSKVLNQQTRTVERLYRNFGNPYVLNDQDLLELFYTVYNKDRMNHQPLRGKNPSDYTTLYVKHKPAKKKGGV